MKKYLKIFVISVFICCFYGNSSYGENIDAFDQCMKRVMSIDKNKNGKPDFVEEINKMLGNPKDMNSFESAANSKPNVIATVITGAAFHKDEGLCNDLIMQIANEPEESFFINLPEFNDTFALKISKKKLLEQYKVALGILVAYTPDWQYPKVISRDYIKNKTWSNYCSNYLFADPFDSVGDNSPINIAMQKIRGYEDEYFLDDPKHMHAFPGLLIEDVTHQDLANLLIIDDIPMAQEMISKFANNVASLTGKCKGHYAYLVSYVVPEKINTGVGSGQKWGTNFAVGGIAVAALGYGYAAAATGSFFTGLFSAAATSAAVPVAGWIVAAGLVIVGGVVALVASTSTETLADLPHMMVIDGPYPL